MIIFRRTEEIIGHEMLESGSLPSSAQTSDIYGHRDGHSLDGRGIFP